MKGIFLVPIFYRFPEPMNSTAGFDKLAQCTQAYVNSSTDLWTVQYSFSSVLEQITAVCG